MIEEIENITLTEKSLDFRMLKLDTKIPPKIGGRSNKMFKTGVIAGYQSQESMLYVDVAFEKLLQIGQGSFGIVSMAKCRKTQLDCAIKICKLKSRIRHWRDSIETVRIYRELCGHDNIVKIYNAWVENDSLYIQMELCQKSLLQHMLENGKVHEDMVWDVIMDILKALEYIHNNGYVHLDVKPDNILLGFDNRYKLADFDLIRMADEWTDNIIAGDDRYRAPEVKINNTFIPRPKNDIFSFGITLLEMAGNFSLSNGGEEWDALRHDKLPIAQLQETISDELICVLSRMLKSDMFKRSTATELLRSTEIRNKSQTLPLQQHSTTEKLMKQNELLMNENLKNFQFLQEYEPSYQNKLYTPQSSNKSTGCSTNINYNSKRHSGCTRQLIFGGWNDYRHQA